VLAFLEANAGVWAAGIDEPSDSKLGKWNVLFRTALKLEIALFNASVYAPNGSKGAVPA
jgi:hypothetical protein